jgi:hypothetical protein
VLVPVIQVRDSRELRRLVGDLKEVADGKQLRKDLIRGLRKVLREYVPKVQAAYRAGPSKMRPKSHGRADLRELLAKSVRIEVRTRGRQAGVRIRADGRRMPDQMKALPKYWEGTNPRWRHQVFGDPDTWVQQPAHPTFYPTLEPSTEPAGHQVDQVLDHIRHKLEGR